MSGREPPDDPALLRSWEDELVADAPGAGREALNRHLAGDPQRLATWVDDRRVVLLLSGLAPKPDTAERVWHLLRAQRPSRRVVTARIRPRRPPARHPVLRLLLPVLGVAAMLAIGTWLLLADTPSLAPAIWREGHDTGARLVASARAGDAAGATELRWPDGTIATLDAGAQAAADDICAFRLERGRVTVAAAHQAAGRRFTVRASEADVAVVGTRFTVEGGASGTRLSVSEGVVELIPHAGRPQRVPAGETWLVPPVGAPQRREVVWMLPPDVALHWGTAQRDGFASRNIQLHAEDRPTQVVWPVRSDGRRWFPWASGLRACLRLRLSDGQGRIGIQLFVLERNANFTVYGDPRPDADGWADLELPLDAARPYHPMALPEPGQAVTGLVVTSEGVGPAFVLAGIRVERPVP